MTNPYPNPNTNPNPRLTLTLILTLILTLPTLITHSAQTWNDLTPGNDISRLTSALQEMTLFWKRMRNPLFVKSAIMLLQLIWKYFRPFIQSKAASLQAAVRLFTGAASGD